MGRVRCQFRPNISVVAKPAIQGVLGVKLALSILELAGIGRCHFAIAAAGKIDAPLVGRRIIRVQHHTFAVAGITVAFVLIYDGSATPDLPVDINALKLGPGIGSRQGVLADLRVFFPCANQRVKIVRSITRRRLSADRWSAGVLLRAPGQLHEDKYGAHYETGSNVFEVHHYLLL